MEPDARVPDWILDRTPTEVKAAYAAAVRKREHGQARDKLMKTAVADVPVGMRGGLPRSTVN